MTAECDVESHFQFQDAVKSRLVNPTINKLYDRYVEYGLEATSLELMCGLSAAEKAPLLHTLSTNVTKEKPVFIYQLGRKGSQGVEIAKFVAASTDLLWAASLMMDDIVDKDTARAGKAAAWVVFGHDQVRKSVWGTVELILNESARRISAESAQYLQTCVDDGLRSLDAPEVRSLNTSPNQLVTNIRQRARFHCEYPMMAIFDSDHVNYQMATLGVEALEDCNLAGQILNDVKDLVPNRLYGRPQFSDIKSGTMTIPLLLAYESMPGGERQEVKKAFGQGSLDAKSQAVLEGAISNWLPRREIYDLVESEYGRFAQTMSEVGQVEQSHTYWDWVNYKMTQAKVLLNM